MDDTTAAAAGAAHVAGVSSSVARERRRWRIDDDRLATERPSVTGTCSVRRRTGVTARRSTLPSLTTQDDLASPSLRPRSGTRSAWLSRRLRSSFEEATFTPICGRMRGSSFSTPTRTLTVAFWRSAVGMMAITLRGIVQSG